MSARKRHVELFKCNSERIQNPACDIGNVNVLSSPKIEHSTKIEEQLQPQTNTVSNLLDNYDTCDNETLKQHRKMKMHSSEHSSSIVRKDSWSIKSITSALRLGLTVVVIMIASVSVHVSSTWQISVQARLWENQSNRGTHLT